MKTIDHLFVSITPLRLQNNTREKNIFGQIRAKKADEATNNNKVNYAI